MANKKNTAEEQENNEEVIQEIEEDVQEIEEKKVDQRESIFIPRAIDGEERTLFVSVNGVNYLLPKGKASMVPPEVAAEIRRSWEAQNAWDDKSEALAEKQPN